MLKPVFSLTTVILTVGVAFGLRKNHRNTWIAESQCSTSKAVQIVKFIEGEPVLDRESLMKVFQHEKAKGKPAIIISLAGDQGIGKSFLMNWCLCYLNYIQYNKSLPVLPKELLGNNKELSGFNWGNKVYEGGTTNGILVWSQPFILKLKDNTEVAVFLMDTQGSHDANANPISNAIVYNLSTLISSIQIYNIVEKPKFFDYKHLVQFSNYGAEATQQQENSLKPFQKLIFLVRDWPDPSSFSYGISGGGRYINEILLALNSQNAEDVKNYKLRIKNLYTNINCFLMPHPGNKIRAVKDFKEFNLDMLSEEFSQELINFMKWIFGTENINSANIKKINGLTINADAVPTYFTTNFDKLLEIGGEYKSIDEWINANTIASNIAALNLAHAHYIEEMIKGLEFIIPYNDRKYQKLHTLCYEASIKKFREVAKLGNEATHDQFESQLKDLMTTQFDKTKKLKDTTKIRDSFIEGARLIGYALVDGVTEILSEIIEVLKPSKK